MDLLALWTSLNRSDKLATISVIISAASLIFSILTFGFMAVLTWLGVRFSAKPRIQIDMKIQLPPDRNYLNPDECAQIYFHLNNVGRFCAKPAANDVLLYINFNPHFLISEAKYGSALECTTQEVRDGKNGSKYVKAKGIQLFHGELGEDVVVSMQAPHEPGVYAVWIAAQCSASDLGIHNFTVQVGPSLQPDVWT